jgi:hypothetical protein
LVRENSQKSFAVFFKLLFSLFSPLSEVFQGNNILKAKRSST